MANKNSSTNSRVADGQDCEVQCLVEQTGISSDHARELQGIRQRPCNFVERRVHHAFALSQDGSDEIQRYSQSSAVRCPQPSVELYCDKHGPTDDEERENVAALIICLFGRGVTSLEAIGAALEENLPATSGSTLTLQAKAGRRIRL